MTLRAMTRACVSACALWWGAGVTSAGTPPLQLELIATFTGESILYATHAPGDDERLFVVGRSGTIYIVNDGVINPAPFLTVPGVSTQLEGGLLGLAFHPQYETNGRFFVFYTESSAPLRTVIAEYNASADPDFALVTETRLLTVEQIAANHNGGWLGFSPIDGYLYIALGDDDIPSNALDNTDIRGSILRLDVNADDFPADPTRNYAIPADNPFVGAPGADEI